MLRFTGLGSNPALGRDGPDYIIVLPSHLGWSVNGYLKKKQKVKCGKLDVTLALCPRVKDPSQDQEPNWQMSVEAMAAEYIPQTFPHLCIMKIKTTHCQCIITGYLRGQIYKSGRWAMGKGLSTGFCSHHLSEYSHNLCESPPCKSMKQGNSIPMTCYLGWVNLLGQQFNDLVSICLNIVLTLLRDGMWHQPTYTLHCMFNILLCRQIKLGADEEVAAVVWWHMVTVLNET